MYMVNLTDQHSFTHPLWNSGGERVLLFNSREEAMEAADAYLRVWHTVPLDAKPEGFGWEPQPESGPLENAVRAIGRFLWQGDRWQAVVFKMEDKKTDEPRWDEETSRWTGSDPTGGFGQASFHFS